MFLKRGTTNKARINSRIRFNPTYSQGSGGKIQEKSIEGLKEKESRRDELPKTQEVLKISGKGKKWRKG